MTDRVRVRLDGITERLAAATPGPWHFAYCSVYATAKIATDDAWWTDERMNDGHTYDHRSAHPCSECGGGRCRRAGDALDQDPIVASVTPSYGDTATGQRIADAEFIAAAPSDVAALAGAVEALLALCDEAEARGRASLPEGMTMSGCEPLASLLLPSQIRRAVAVHLDPKENPNG